MSQKYCCATPKVSKLKLAQKALLSIAASLSLGVAAFGHGSLEGSRILQVRLAGPSGSTPAAWNESYYTWNQNSNNFTSYAAPGFSYSDYVANGSIHNAGVNNGIDSGLNFSGLNTPSANWETTAITAGDLLTLRFAATAPHDPSFFAVYLTKQGFDGTTQTLGWDNLEFLGKWSIGSVTNPVTIGSTTIPLFGTMMSYDWNVVIPEDRQGFHSVVVVWQREDPAGEAFFATRDIQVTAVPEPGTTALAIVSGIGILAFSRLRKKN